MTFHADFMIWCSDGKMHMLTMWIGYGGGAGLGSGGCQHHAHEVRHVLGCVLGPIHVRCCFGL